MKLKNPLQDPHKTKEITDKNCVLFLCFLMAQCRIDRVILDYHNEINTTARNCFVCCAFIIRYGNV